MPQASSCHSQCLTLSSQHAWCLSSWSSHICSRVQTFDSWPRVERETLGVLRLPISEMSHPAGDRPCTQVVGVLRCPGPATPLPGREGQAACPAGDCKLLARGSVSVHSLACPCQQLGVPGSAHADWAALGLSVLSCSPARQGPCRGRGSPPSPVLPRERPQPCQERGPHEAGQPRGPASPNIADSLSTLPQHLADVPIHLKPVPGEAAVGTYTWDMGLTS